jgi:diguanylate cyclase (GGDEF)-like protein
MVLIPATGLLLVVAACTSVVLAYRREATNARAHLALTRIEVQLNRLQGLPWLADSRGASPLATGLALAAGEHSVQLRVAGLLRSDPPASLASVPAGLAANFATLGPSVSSPGAPARAAAQTRTLEAVTRRLDMADAVYAHRAVTERWLARGSFLGAIAGLFAGFLFYFRRSERTRARLSAEATTDSLTGLANRSAFVSRVASLEQEPAPAAVVFVDLDEFKDVNDVFGHGGGDAVLREVAARLRRHTRAGDVCARLGGDEFAVLLAGADRGAALASAQRIAAALREPVAVEGGVARISASIGVASAAEIGFETLVHWADMAMYAAKDAGPGMIEVFEPGLLAGEASRVGFEQQLAAAADADELVVHYQPILALADGGCDGVEALVRWRHPERGLLQPGEFVATAERTGAIVDIGAHVLRTACADVAALQRSTDRLLAAYVNVSGRQLADPRFGEVVSRALSASGLPAPQLVLELTEGALLHSAGVADRLAELAEQGVRIALDDFGTGYASLTTLRSLPLDAVKIDRSFVARATESRADEAVVAAIVTMAGHLGLRTIAEGVERPEEQLLLARVGAGSVQGFLHARPAALDDLRAWLVGAGLEAGGRRPARAPDLAPGFSV